MGNEKTLDSEWANLLSGELVIRALRSLGVEHFVVSPGSRSSPLTMAFEEIEGDGYSVVLDERSAAFQALGRIKATGKPVGLICTSGTAGAHYYPALIEARESGLPLVVITADRPPELRYCHAGQTIDQLKLFGSYPVFHVEMPIPVMDKLLFRQVREICRSAIEAAMGSPGGPVHLNCPFREPFFPIEGSKPALDCSFLDGLKPVLPAISESGTIPELPERTLILAGPRPGKDSNDEVEAVLALAKKTGWPILADASNPLRHHPQSLETVVVHYDRIARDEELWNELAPEAVVMWGEPPTSKVLRQKLIDSDVSGYLVCGGKQTMNSIHGRIEWIGSSMANFSGKCSNSAGNYLYKWIETDRGMESSLRIKLQEPHSLFEGDIHRMLGRALPDSAAVFYASSMAIRDAEWFMPANGKGFRPFSQRGANGIDGTLSLARGVAGGLKSPLWLVTGDLAFLHDGNGLLGAADDNSGHFVVLINNNGGGIFELLSVAQRCQKFEKLYATPQNVELSQLVAAHGGRHHVCEDVDSLESAICSWNGEGLVVAEIKVERKLSKELHKQHLHLKD